MARLYDFGDKLNYYGKLAIITGYVKNPVSMLKKGYSKYDYQIALKGKTVKGVSEPEQKVIGENIIGSEYVFKI